MASKFQVQWDEAPDPDDVEPITTHLPDTASSYLWTEHFGDRVVEEPRPPDLSAVDRTLADATAGEGDGSRYLFQHTIEGIQITIVLGVEGRLLPTLISAYPTVTDLTAARTGDRWSDVEVNHAWAVTLIDKQDPLGNEWVLHEVREPVENAWGHRIVTDSGWDYARCVECGQRFPGKGKLNQLPCE